MPGKSAVAPPALLYRVTAAQVPGVIHTGGAVAARKRHHATDMVVVLVRHDNCRHVFGRASQAREAHHRFFSPRDHSRA